MSTNQPTKKFSTPGYVSTNIKDTNEKALQRALLMQGTSLLDGKEVKWLDIELPIEFTDNSRRKCVDLIGKDNDGQLYLCELKFSGNSDTPRDAESQLLEYFELIKYNAQKLEDNNIHHKKQESFSWIELALSSPKLCIMADATYWCKWENKVEKVKLQHPDEVKCFAIDIDSNIFANQRAVNGGELYTPSLVENHWHSLYTYSYEIIEL